MARYVIGDVQGCFDELQLLLDKIHFNQDRDQLYFAGDLINRGTQSRQVLDFVINHPDNCFTVLGNHDLNCLAIGILDKTPKKHDTFGDMLQSPQRTQYLNWLRQQPLAINLPNNLGFLSHAGLYPQWTRKDAIKRAVEVSHMLQSDRAFDFFAVMYGNQPETWNHALEGIPRWRFIVNAFTRMRFISQDFQLDMQCKLPIGQQPEGLQPWYHSLPTQASPIYFGHWAALNGVTNRPDIIATDTGCAWGGTLSAYNIETLETIAVPYLAK